MTAPIFDMAADSGEWGTDVHQIRENIVSLAIFAAGNGSRLPGWDTEIVYDDDDQVAQVILTLQADPDVKIKLSYLYDAGTLDQECYCYDRGAGAGWEAVPNGLLTYTYTGDNVTSITPGTAAGTECDDLGDPTILWDTVPVDGVILDPASSVFNNLYFYEHGFCGFWYAKDWLAEEPTIDHTFSTGDYLIKYDLVSVVSGSADITLNYTTGQEGVWEDLFRANIQLDDTTADSVREEQVIDITIATDDGAGAPVANTSKTKRVTLVSYRGNSEYTVRDRFTGTNGTALTAHALEVGSGGWTADASAFEIQSNRAKASSGTDIRATFDAGVVDCVMYADLRFNSEDCGLIGRAQDASNYWLLLVEDADQTDPVLKLIEVNTGTPTTRASVTMTGRGPISVAYDLRLKLGFNGDDIYGAAQVLLGHYDWVTTTFELTYNSSSFNTETRFGIAGTGTAATWDEVYVSEIEIGLVI